jgi:hypothetical protein
LWKNKTGFHRFYFAVLLFTRKGVLRIGLLLRFNNALYELPPKNSPSPTHRPTMNPEQLRTWQWKRIHLDIHFCRQISNNCRWFLHWTAHESQHPLPGLPGQLRQYVRRLRVRCFQSIIASIMIRARLYLLLLRMRAFPWMAAPSLKNVLMHGAAMIGFYHAAQEIG